MMLRKLSSTGYFMFHEKKGTFFLTTTVKTCEILKHYIQSAACFDVFTIHPLLVPLVIKQNFFPLKVNAEGSKIGLLQSHNIVNYIMTGLFGKQLKTVSKSQLTMNKHNILHFMEMFFENHILRLLCAKLGFTRRKTSHYIFQGH